MGAPLRIDYRPSGKARTLLDFVLLELRSDLDPPLLIGYQLPGRGRRELRVDRIVRVERIETQAQT